MKKGNIAQISEYSSGTSQYQCIVLQLQVHQKDQNNYSVHAFQIQTSFQKVILLQNLHIDGER